MILMPVSHDRAGTRRYPYITLGIIAANILIFIVSAVMDHYAEKEVLKKGSSVISFYQEHPCLNLPEDTARVLLSMSRSKEAMFALLSGKAGCKQSSNDEQENEDIILENAASQENLDILISEFKDSMGNFSFLKYGYIPSKRGFFNLFTSMFLHGGIFHLVFNMWFLFLCGCNIEDLWGRAVYPIFYLIGGIAATLMHGMMFTQSNAPLIGASGAIAALMGAFMIRLYDTKIRFFYFFFAFRMYHGFFYAKAYIMLFLWLLQQFWGVLTDTGGAGGVAFWAHIGGFVFGAGAAMLLKLSGMEASIEDSVPDMVSFETKVKESSTEEVIHYLKKILAENPDDALACKQLGDMYMVMEDRDAACKAYQSSISLYLKNGYPNEAIKEYREQRLHFPVMMLFPSDQMKLAKALEKENCFDEAAVCYKNLANYYAAEAEKNKDQKNSIAQGNRETYEALWKKMKEKAKGQTIKENLKPLKIKPKIKSKIKPNKSDRNEDKKKQVYAKPKGSVRMISPQGKKIYKIISAAPIIANRIMPAPDGIDINRPDDKILLFKSIYFICVFSFEQQENQIYADIFLAARMRPFRVSAAQVNYADFSFNQPNTLMNFQKFISYIISNSPIVYLDHDTAEFLKKRRVRSFESAIQVEQHEKFIWAQLMNDVRLECESCGQVYRLQNKKVPDKGVRQNCRKCGRVVMIRPIDI